MRNAEVADMFDEIADYQELAGENVFKVRAHRRAAETIRSLGVDIAALAEAGRLREIDGVGEATAEKTKQCLGSGTCDYLQKLRERYPATIRELLRVPGLGPRKVAQVYQELDIVSVDDLAKAAQED
ncbi:MAG: DNA polymerase/3'-5' exonuclease PolX, partial [Armatimonadetes bacterium]|nr:DNA polymerase/3'-5' exonuclease PolX [Armatimonadota bacterium]